MVDIAKIRKNSKFPKVTKKHDLPPWFFKKNKYKGYKNLKAIEWYEQIKTRAYFLQSIYYQSFYVTKKAFEDFLEQFRHTELQSGHNPGVISAHADTLRFAKNREAHGCKMLSIRQIQINDSLARLHDKVYCFLALYDYLGKY